MKNIFVDADIIMSAFDDFAKGRTPEKINEAKERFRAWIASDETALFTNPLVKFEVLRAVHSEPTDARYVKLASAFTLMGVIDISSMDADLATELWQHAMRSGDFKPDTRSFDLLHFACAKNNKLEIASQNRSDMKTIETAYVTLNNKK
jgi:hypothetical protein